MRNRILMITGVGPDCEVSLERPEVGLGPRFNPLHDIIAPGSNRAMMVQVVDSGPARERARMELSGRVSLSPVLSRLARGLSPVKGPTEPGFSLVHNPCPKLRLREVSVQPEGFGVTWNTGLVEGLAFEQAVALQGAAVQSEARSLAVGEDMLESWSPQGPRDGMRDLDDVDAVLRFLLGPAEVVIVYMPSSFG